MRPHLAALPFLAAGLANAQSPKPSFEQFEVASIKPTAPADQNGGVYIRMQSAHQFRAKNYSVNGLIAAAYDLNPKAISGGPSWIQSERYEVTAVTPGDLRPTYADQMRMLRKMLANRFQLTFHHEMKEFAAYELTVGKDGPKFKPTQMQPDEDPNVTSTIFPGKDNTIDYAKLPARNVTMGNFASVLQRAIVDRPVVDHTGLSGRYDFDLEWTPDSSNFGGKLPPGAPDSGKPGLFTAMLEQLGLKFAPARLPVETLVIDRIERPTEN